MSVCGNYAKHYWTCQELLLDQTCKASWKRAAQKAALREQIVVAPHKLSSAGSSHHLHLAFGKRHTHQRRDEDSSDQEHERGIEASGTTAGDLH